MKKKDYIKYYRQFIVLFLGQCFYDFFCAAFLVFYGFLLKNI